MKTKPTPMKNVAVFGKLFFASAILLSTANHTFAQACDAGTFNMPNLSSPNCTGYLYDSGGSGSNYANNETRQFNIWPGSATTSVTLKFTAFNTEASHDVVRVYNGLGGSGTLLGTFSGSSLPPTLTSTTGKMSILFSSDGTVVKSGWAAVWTSIGGTCGGTFNMPSLSTFGSKGTLYDNGGPGANYSNNENKVFNIVPTSATFVCIKFNSFSTEAGFDFVRVYNNINGTGTLLGTFSGNSIPGNITSNTGKMSITFVSDAATTSSGWTAIWTSDGTSRVPMTGIEEGALVENKITLFPNPAEDKVSIGFTVTEEGTTKVALYNVAGMETVVLDKNLSAGEHTIDFDASSLAPGVYFCRVITGSSVLVEKLVKN